MVDLSSVRKLRRREIAERRVRAVLEGNRAALSRLFATGLIFTQKGSRAARDLLRAHQSLLKTADLFAQLLQDVPYVNRSIGKPITFDTEPFTFFTIASPSS